MANKEADVCIIVPVYNVEGYIAACLDSLLLQTHDNVVIICVDDGSSDHSLDILHDYAARDKRIIVLAQTNAGQAAARNRALEIARAPYIMFCDSDDWYAPDMCEKMLAALQRAPEADYVACAVQVHYEHADRMSKSDAKYYSLKHRGLVDIDSDILLSTDVSVCNKLFRRELIEQHGIRFPEGVLYEDTAFYHLYGLCSRRAIYLPDERLYHYRRRSGSTMSDTFDGISRRAVDMLRIAESIHTFMTAQGMLPERTRHYGRLFFDLFTSALGFAHRAEDKLALLTHADTFLTRTGLDFSGDTELTYRRALLTRRLLPGAIRKRWGGLLTTKYKAHCAKHYLLGLPICITHTLPA